MFLLAIFLFNQYFQTALWLLHWLKLSILLFKSADHFTTSSTLSCCSILIFCTVVCNSRISLNLCSITGRWFSIFFLVYLFLKFVLIHFLLALAILIVFLFSAICLLSLTFYLFVFTEPWLLNLFSQ